MGAAEIAAAYGGKRSGRSYIMPCVTHDDRKPSLSIADGRNGDLVVYCFCGCDSLGILAELRARGHDTGQRDHPPRSPSPPPRLQRPAQPAHRPNAGNKLEGILARCQPLGRSPVMTNYFPARGVAARNGGDLRYLAPSDKHPWPTMVGIVTDFVTNDRISLHFTALSKDGRSKAPIDKPKRLLAGHRKAGGVVRLTDDADVTSHLGVAEGIETALAVMTALGASADWLPVWAAIDAGNLASLPVVDGIERLTIFADTDSSGTGQRAARAIAARWHDAGREVFIAQPPAPPGGKADWNDRIAA